MREAKKSDKSTQRDKRQSGMLVRERWGGGEEGERGGRRGGMPTPRLT